ncbi:MAG: DUF262 domain-containing protein [Candidatus Hodarchaeota archaeon]
MKTFDLINKAEEQIRKKQKSIQYDLRTYAIHWLVEKFRTGMLFIPNYQRGLVWRKSDQSKFIESLIIGLPTSLLFVAETGDYRVEIIDGVQRIITLETFVNNDLVLSDLEALDYLNGFRFSDLSNFQRSKFLDRSLSLLVLSYETSMEDRLEIYLRMNFKGKILTKSELRNILQQGPFIDFIKECSTSPIFQDLFKWNRFIQSRGEAEDLIIRFFALSDNLSQLKTNFSNFLDNYVSIHKNDFDKDRLSNEFNKTLIFLNKFFKHIFIESKYRFSKALFETLSVGVNLALREQPNLIPTNYDWIESENFRNLTRTHGLQMTKRIKERIYFVKDNLLKGAARFE